jgi:uncharacterized protein (DUF427 family)
MMSNKAPGFEKNPSHRVDIAPATVHVKVELNGQTVAETKRAQRLDESNHGPVYYVPRADVNTMLLKKTEHTSYCPYKGHASYYTIHADGREAENAIWSYETPYDECAAITEHMAFYPGRVDALTVDGEKVVPPAPKK